MLSYKTSKNLDKNFTLDYCLNNKLVGQLGSVAGPKIQANGRLTFEDDLRSGGMLYLTTQ